MSQDNKFRPDFSVIWDADHKLGIEIKSLNQNMDQWPEVTLQVQGDERFFREVVTVSNVYPDKFYNEVPLKIDYFSRVYPEGQHQLELEYQLPTKEVAKKAKIHLPPGTRLRSILEFVYSPKVMMNIFFEILGDIQYEWMEAVVKGEKWKSRWIRIRGLYSIFSAIIVHLNVAFWKKVIHLWKISG